MAARWKDELDFSWLNGPAEGTYGFAVARSATEPGSVARMTREVLIEAARSFVESFYEPGGIGEEDFPDHIPARARSKGH